MPFRVTLQTFAYVTGDDILISDTIIAVFINNDGQKKSFVLESV
jgi:hypothetical protein